jgi:predicted  nucleic acid-binding Zn-ribbon protein
MEQLSTNNKLSIQTQMQKLDDELESYKDRIIAAENKFKELNIKFEKTNNELIASQKESQQLKNEVRLK